MSRKPCTTVTAGTKYTRFPHPHSMAAAMARSLKEPHAVLESKQQLSRRDFWAKSAGQVFPRNMCTEPGVKEKHGGSGGGRRVSRDDTARPLKQSLEVRTGKRHTCRDLNRSRNERGGCSSQWVRGRMVGTKPR